MPARVSAGAVLCVVVFVSAAMAQTTAIPGVVAAGAPVELIQDGFKSTEGPIAAPDGSLYFTETSENRIQRVDPSGKITVFMDNTNGSNALAIDSSGRIITVQRVKPRIGVIAPANQVKVLSDNYNGEPFVVPNDLTLAKNGGVYFTDPGSAEKRSHSLYYISPAGKTVRAADGIDRPNGVTLGRDEKTLYLANTAGQEVFAFDVQSDGTLKNQRPFARLKGMLKTDAGMESGADGLAIDQEGRLYVATHAGVEVFDSKGAALGVIPIPKKPQNLAFAGKDKSVLYVVGRGAVYKVQTLTKGFSGRAK